MDSGIVLLVVGVAAAVALFLWRQRDRGQPPDVAKPQAPVAAPTPSPAAATRPAAAAATAPMAAAGTGSLGSYDDYRRTSPSNMLYGKLTCNRCGSNLIRSSGGTASCSNCGAALYRT